MNLKTWAPLIIAIALGLVAAKLARDVVSRVPANAQASVAGVSVVVMKQDVSAGQEIKPEFVQLAKLATEQAPEHSFTETAQVVGRVTQAQLLKGQALLDGLLAAPGSVSGLQSLVPDGMRAITIEVSESSGVAGLLVPGCHVDVLATITEGQNQAVTKTVVQNIKVTAVGQKMSKLPSLLGGAEESKELSRTVTLLATPKDAELLDLLATTGHPRLVLRGWGDEHSAVSTGTSMSDIRGEDKIVKPNLQATPPIAQTPVKQAIAEVSKARMVSVIRGGVETKVALPDVPETAMTSTDLRSAIK